ncbi:MAG: DUF2183 domain-containing protein [Oligoflexia bacterium]|nr:DUF2183 domain-containing protein [Oligoflexia bacterium]
MQSNSEAKPIHLISDLDDTIKISHTQSKLITVYRGLFRSSAFSGMAKLYQEMLTCDDSDFTIVSSSPPTIEKKIRAFIHKNHFPEPKLILRDWIRSPAVKAFKVKALHKEIEKSKHPLILIGDDTQYDPEIYYELSMIFPKKILCRYIRKVRGRELPADTIGFFTAFDIACHEYTQGRLTNDSVLAVGEEILKAKKLSRILPSFSLIPPANFAPIAEFPEKSIQVIWEQISSKIQIIANKKSSKTKTRHKD